MSKENVVATVTAALLQHPWPVGTRVRARLDAGLRQEVRGATGTIMKVDGSAPNHVYYVLCDDERKRPSVVSGPSVLERIPDDCWGFYSPQRQLELE